MYNHIRHSGMASFAILSLLFSSDVSGIFF